MTALSISLLSTRIDLVCGDGVDVGPALDFLSTHFGVRAADDGAGAPLATLYVSAETAGVHLPPAHAEAEDLHVRKSASDFFTIPARRTHDGGREYVECVRTGTRFVLDPVERTVHVALGADGAMDLVELIRDLTLKHQENAGTAVLHATAAYRDGAVVLITGSKGAGKSTLLLELVEHHGYKIMSGDKTLAVEGEDGSVRATGWPDYPHLGYGTVVKYPGLREIAGLADDYRPAGDHAFSPLGKFAVAPAPFRERFPSAPRGLDAPVVAVLHPSIGPGDRTVAEAVPDRRARVAVLAGNMESAFDGPHAGWHSYLPDLRAGHDGRRHRIVTALGAAPAWRVTGPGDLAGDTLPAALRTVAPEVSA
ncbi:hypothetical protein [Streptosporangium sp. NPDC051022]|uniref:hypothetical protein n=1 Tax=Streptosporangium sp. NPDC051022 TaxID=3155752 RepID=UPI0034120D35